jgi:hypothetical protein
LNAVSAYRDEDRTGAGAGPPESFAAKDVEILVGHQPDDAFVSVGRLELTPGDEFHTLSFAPTSAQYVLVRVLSNHGGSRLALGEVEVLAAGAAPADVDPYRTAVWPNVAAMGHRPSIAWQILAYLVLTAAEVMVSVTCLEFSYTQAPRKMKSLVMALYLLSVSAGNAFTSAVNFYIGNPDGTSKLEGAAYYGFFTVVMAVAAVVFVGFAPFYRGRTYIQEDELGAAEGGQT